MTKIFSHPLYWHWLITGIVAMMIILLWFSSYPHWHRRLSNDEMASTLIFWRTLCYIFVILILPFSKLTRFILLRLNQTMPPKIKTNEKIAQHFEKIEQIAKYRYRLTIISHQLVMLVIAGLSFMLIQLGDTANSAHILTLLALMGVYLRKPSVSELMAIITPLRAYAHSTVNE